MRNKHILIALNIIITIVFFSIPEPSHIKVLLLTAFFTNIILILQKPETKPAHN